MSWGTAIRQVTQVRYMPPWQPDPTYSNLLGQNTLTTTQIQQIADWVADGMPRGDVALEPTPPTFPTGSQLGTPDLTLSYAEMLHHPAGGDDYRVIVLPTGLTQDRDIRAVEMRPGICAISRCQICLQVAIFCASVAKISPRRVVLLSLISISLISI